MTRKTKINLKKETLEKLTSIGKMNQTHDDLIIELLDHADGCDHFWCDRF